MLIHFRAALLVIKLCRLPGWYPGFGRQEPGFIVRDVRLIVLVPVTDVDSTHRRECSGGISNRPLDNAGRTGDMVRRTVISCN